MSFEMGRRTEEDEDEEQRRSAKNNVVFFLRDTRRRRPGVRRGGLVAASKEEACERISERRGSWRKPPPRKLQSRPWTTTRPTTRETTIAWRFPRRMERDAATTNPTRRKTPPFEFGRGETTNKATDTPPGTSSSFDFFSRRKLGVADERRVGRDVGVAEQQEHHRVVAVVVSWMYPFSWIYVWSKRYE